MRLTWVVVGLAVAACACGGVDSPGVPDAEATGDGSFIDVSPGADDAAAGDAGRGADAALMRPDGGSPPGGDGGMRSCAPSGTCASGPMCGTRCCGMGEWCDTSTDTCFCGTSPACGVGDMCAAPGPVGGDSCGILCCGVSGPCPL